MIQVGMIVPSVRIEKMLVSANSVAGNSADGLSLTELPVVREGCDPTGH